MRCRASASAPAASSAAGRAIPSFDPWNITLADYRQTFADLDAGRVPQVVPVYCPIPTNFDPSLAPPGAQLLTACAVAPCTDVPRPEDTRPHARNDRAFIDGLLGAMEALMPGCLEEALFVDTMGDRGAGRRGSARRAARRSRRDRRRRRWGAIARRCARRCPGSTSAATAPAAAASAPSWRAPAPWSASTRSPPTACYAPSDMPVPPKEFLGLSQEIIPFNKFLGITVEEARDGYARLLLPFRPEFIGDASRPALHGGVISTLIDTCGGFAVWTQLETSRTACRRIDLRVDYLAPGAPRRSSPRRVVRVGNRVGVVDVRCWQPSAAGAHGCHGQGRVQHQAQGGCAMNVVRRAPPGSSWSASARAPSPSSAARSSSVRNSDVEHRFRQPSDLCT